MNPVEHTIAFESYCEHCTDTVGFAKAPDGSYFCFLCGSPQTFKGASGDRKVPLERYKPELFGQSRMQKLTAEYLTMRSADAPTNPQSGQPLWDRQLRTEAIEATLKAKTGLVPKKAMPRCGACNEGFGLLGRGKKHCYACGHIFCSKCMRGTRIIQGQKNSLPVCISCSDEANCAILRDQELESGWLPDECAPMCVACSKSFGVFTRRHHCRSCGSVMCAKCTSKALVGGYSGYQKICAKCERGAPSVVLRGE